MIVYLNGRWLDAQEATIPIDDRGFLLADGVFETARLVGGSYFGLEQHLDRFADSARELRLPLPERSEIRAIVEEIARRNDFSDGSLRVTLTRGRGGRGLDTRGAGPPTLLVTLAPIAADWREGAARGWHLITAKTRRPPPQSVPSQLKALGRVYSILAHLEAEAAGVDDALLLTADGDVAEGPTWNFFWRAGDLIRTAALAAGVLEGITRAIVMRLAGEAGYRTEEGVWPPTELLAADEAFATQTSTGIVPVRTLDGRPFASDRCAAMLQHRYWQYVETSLGGAGQ